MQGSFEVQMAERKDMKNFFIINDAPNRTEKAYNAFRMAMNLQNREDEIEVRFFLLADAVACALPNQIVPNGFYNIQRMLKSLISHGGEVQT